MKRMIAWLLLVTMLLGAFAGCGSNTEQTPTQAATEAVAAANVEGINAAIDYLKMFYKDSGSKTGADFERYGIVRIAGVPYEVTWTADVSEDLVKAVVNEDGSVTIDVSEECEQDTPYTLTATIADEVGNSAAYSWEYILPAGLGSDYCAIVDMAYALEKGAAMETPATLVGTVVAINTAWSEEYKNITVTIVVKGREDKPIECYRLKGEGAKDLAVGDLITVTGIIKNYNGKIEFDAGSEVVGIAKGAGDLGDIPTDPVEIVTAAYALEVGAALPYTATLTGEVIGIDTPYSPDYKNISVDMKIEGCEDMPILCYRMKGTGVETLMPGDTVTVTGTIKNYNGTIEFDAGCQAVSIVKGENSMEILTDPNEILAAAVDLEPGEYLPYPVTLTGEIIGLGYGGYSEKYGNITVSLRVGDGYYVKCFRMKGVDIDKIWLGDEITVTGNLMDYDGTIEFDAGCIMESWVDKPNPKAPSDPKEIVKAAYKLSNFSSLPYYCTLTGEVTYAGNFSPTPGNRNIDMIVEGKKITAYKLSGPGVEGIKEGDTITVWGMLKNYWGTIEFDAGCKLVSKQSKVVKDLFALEPGETMKGEQVLTGKVTSVKIGSTSSDVKISVKGETINCPGLIGYGYDKLEKKDTITVRGILENKNGTYQFRSGSEIQSWSNYNRARVNAHTSSSSEIAYAATQLGTADSLNNFFVWGNVVRVDTPYDKKYENLTVTIKVGKYEIQCFRMKGDGADKIGVGDKVGVSGNLINYKGTIEFGAGCKLVKYEITEKKPVKVPETLKEQMEDAVKNGTNSYKTTVKGKIVTEPVLRSEYNSYNFYVEDKETGLWVYCYSVGEGKKLAKGDEVKIVGCLTSYSNQAQFNYTAKLTVTKKASNKPEELTGVAKDLADAAKLANKEYLDRTTTVSGKVSAIVKASDYGKNQWDFYLSDGTNVIRCYFVKFDREVEVKVGDKITISGNLTAHDGEPQFDKTATIKKDNCADAEKIPEGEKPAQPAEGAAITIKEALALGATNNKVRITGKVTSITNEQYGNMYIEDSTGSILVWGTYDEAGNRYDAMPNKPVVGKTYTFYGKIKTYNGTVEIDSAIVEGLSTGSGSGPEKPEELTGLAKDIAEAMKLSVGSSLSYTTTVTGTITDTPTESSYTKGTWKFTVSDGTASVLCYYVPVTGGTPAKGDKITVSGHLKKYNSTTVEFTDEATATLSKGADAEEECTHKNTTTTTVKATCTKTGSKTVVCDDCGKTVSTKTIKKLDHTYVEGICSCGAEDPDYVAPSKDESTTPSEGDSTTPSEGGESTPVECEHVDENGDGTCDKCLENPEA